MITWIQKQNRPRNSQIHDTKPLSSGWIREVPKELSILGKLKVETQNIKIDGMSQENVSEELLQPCAVEFYATKKNKVV